MKKFLSAVSILFAVILTAFTLAACTHDEDHSTHSYGQWTTTATCTEAGVKTRTCTICGDKETETDLPLGHLTSDWETEKAATCTEDGLQIKKCSRCGNEVDSEAIPAKGHHFTVLKDRKDSTCTEDGYLIYGCEDCDETETSELKAAHKWTDWVEKVPGTCTTPRIEERSCNVCGKIEEEEGEYGHVFPVGGGWGYMPAPTCEKAGKRTHTCTVCHNSFEETVEALGHDWSEWTETSPSCTDPGTRSRSCSHENCDKGGVEFMSPYDPDFPSYLRATGHKYPEDQWEIILEPLCTESGLRYRECTVCHTRDEDTIPALGHTYEKVGEYWVCTGLNRDGSTHEWYGDYGAEKGPDGNYIFTGINTYNFDKNYTIAKSYNGEPITSIQAGAFGANRYGREIEGLIIYDNIKNIGANAFAGCTKLKSVIIYADGTDIDINAFDGCTRLKEITIIGNVNSIGASAFLNCDSLETLTINGSVKKMGNGAFSGCSDLRGVYINDLVAWCQTEFGTAGNDADRANPLFNTSCTLYYNEEVIKHVDIPSGVTSIGNFCFIGCADLTEITIPSTVTSIGNGALARCRSLKTIHYGGTLEQWRALEKGEGMEGIGYAWDFEAGRYEVRFFGGEITPDGEVIIY